MISLLLLLFATNYALIRHESFETAVAGEDVKCSGMGVGKCKPGNRQKPEMLWQMEEYYARGTPKQIDGPGCQALCEKAGPKFGPGCCFNGALFKKDDQFDYDENDPMWSYTGRSTIVSCFYFKEGDYESYKRSRREEYRMVCRKPNDWTHCTEHKDCSGDMFCSDNACQPCTQCKMCRDGVGNTCGSCYPLYERPCRGAEAETLMVQDQNSQSTVVLNLFAVIGLVCLLLGAGKYYCAKK